MTTESPHVAWPILDATERRLLGVLVEKAKTTPENYPLSVNALTTGSNQKSNRDPVMDLSDDDVAAALAELQRKGLVTRITGGRVERWRHNLYDVWTSDKVELAILTELLLRGAQTEGELRGRASRMEPIDDLDKLRQVLRPLAERKLVVFLGPEGRRGTLIVHGFLPPDELERTRSHAATQQSESPSAPPPAASSTGWQQAVNELRAEVSELRGQLNALRQEFESSRAT